MTRRTFLAASIMGTTASAGSPYLTGTVQPGQVPDFAISHQVEISAPEKAFEESFWIAARLTEEMRRLAFQHYGKDGWLSVSNGKVNPAHVFDPRDFCYASRCAAYLYGHDPAFAVEMGKRIFQDEIDGNDGHILLGEFGATMKHCSDYIAYLEQDGLVKENWDRLLKMTSWLITNYDHNDDGLVENGDRDHGYLWCLMIGEDTNFPRLPETHGDVIVIENMQMCQLFQTMSACSTRWGLPGGEWLDGRARKVHTALEGPAYDPDAGHYYLIYRGSERRWYHSLKGINEYSRELDVTPYYAALVSGNFSRGARIAQYAQKVLLDDQVFPMPLQYPPYTWLVNNPTDPENGLLYHSPYIFVPGGCWEESYYNCVRAWSHFGLVASVYEAVKRRSEAHVRDQDCWEWFKENGEVGEGARDRYGISASAHISAIIEGLYGITPARSGFSEINIHPNFPPHWARKPVSIRVTLPGNGFLKYVYVRDEASKTLTLTVETDKQRTGHFRLFVPEAIDSVKWNADTVLYDGGLHPGGGSFVLLTRPFKNDRLQIKLATCASKGLPARACLAV